MSNIVSFHRRAIAASIFALCVASTGAFGEHSNDNEDGAHDHIAPDAAPAMFVGTELQANRAVFRVSGIVCSFCAAGVTKKLGKVDGVDASQFTKGVLVEIEQQRVIVALTSIADFSLPQAYKAILKGGYEPLSAAIVDADRNVRYFDSEGQPCTAAC